jgi:ribonucleotide reductase alpha subunit
MTTVEQPTRRSQMQVRKRNGDAEPMDVNKIVRAVERWCDDLRDVDPMRVATKTISGLYDGATTAELDRLSIRTAAEMIGEDTARFVKDNARKLDFAVELRDNTGEDARRTHNLNIANWVPDEFMRRVEADETWSLIDPNETPDLPDLSGDAFDDAYRRIEAQGRFVRLVRARDLFGRMMRTLAQTGNGWMTFKDRA